MIFYMVFYAQLHQSSSSPQRRCPCPGGIRLGLCVIVLVTLPLLCAGSRMENRSSLMPGLRLRTLEFCSSTSCGWTMRDITSVLLPTVWAPPVPLPSCPSSWGRGCLALLVTCRPHPTLALQHCSPGTHLNTIVTRSSASQYTTNARQVRERVCVCFRIQNGEKRNALLNDEIIYKINNTFITIITVFLEVA